MVVNDDGLGCRCHCRSGDQELDCAGRLVVLGEFAVHFADEGTGAVGDREATNAVQVWIGQAGGGHEDFVDTASAHEQGLAEFAVEVVVGGGQGRGHPVCVGYGAAVGCDCGRCVVVDRVSEAAGAVQAFVGSCPTVVSTGTFVWIGYTEYGVVLGVFPCTGCEAGLACAVLEVEPEYEAGGHVHRLHRYEFLSGNIGEDSTDER